MKMASTAEIFFRLRYPFLFYSMQYYQKKLPKLTAERLIKISKQSSYTTRTQLRPFASNKKLNLHKSSSNFNSQLDAYTLSSSFAAAINGNETPAVMQTLSKSFINKDSSL